jgi:penicillin-binding protein 2
VSGPSRPGLRLGILGVVALSLFVTLFARLSHLQLLHGPEYRRAAERNTVRTVAEPAPRGRILDRDGTVLVDNRPSNVVAVDRALVRAPAERKALLDRLSRFLGVPPSELADRLGDRGANPYAPVPVAEDVDEPIMIRLREHREELPGVVVQRAAVRSYPFGRLAAHVLGYVGQMTAEEVADRGRREAPGATIGKAGAERTFDDHLRGVDGELRVEVDADGTPLRVLGRRPPVAGDDVVLSIDAGVQQVAEAALASGLAHAQQRRFVGTGERFAADAGSVVVLDPRAGTMLAMASAPGFDLPGLADGVSHAEAAALFDEVRAPFANRAVLGQYAPGSTWKLVTATAALREGLLSPTATVRDDGTFTIPGCVRDCERGNAGGAAYGTVDLARALSVSSDVFFYAQGAAFWRDQARFGSTPIQDAAAALGFGTATGVALPTEAEGRVVTPDARQLLHADDPAAFPEERWYVGDNVNLAIGQGDLTVTPLQLATAYATFANGGTRLRPNTALRVQERDGTTVRTFPRRVAAQVELPEQVREPVLRGLVGATATGTAAAAFAGWPHASLPVAGKTGTAEAHPKQDTALFTAAVPAGPAVTPRFVVSVVMEQAGFGADAAAPVGRAVLEAALARVPAG